MATLTEVMAAVVVHSSAMAMSHFGISAPQVDKPAPAQLLAEFPARLHAWRNEHRVLAVLDGVDRGFRLRPIEDEVLVECDR